MVHIVLQERRVVTTKKKHHIYFRRNNFANHNQAQAILSQKSRSIYAIGVDSPMIDTVNQKFFCVLILYTFSLQWSNIIFSVSIQGIEWSLDFGPDSVPLTVKNLVQEKTINSQEVLLAAWKFSLSQSQHFWATNFRQFQFTQTRKGPWGWETKCSQA